MNSFRTEIQPATFKEKISYKDTFFCIGSCFAQNIHQKLQEYSFNSIESPLGIAYNPISIFENIIKTETPIIIKKNNIYYSYGTHSQIFANSENEILEKLKKYEYEILEHIKNTNWLIITLGTAMVYRLKKEDKIVSNCHKMPSELFDKFLLSNAEITEKFEKFYHKLLNIQPNIKIILTVSPVRHLKETLEINSVSKSILRLFCHETSLKFSNIYYFPAYEIVQDDLRDYRFYEADMLHPSAQAIEYVWQKFLQSGMDIETIKNAELCFSVHKDLQHRPFQPKSFEYLQFLKTLKIKAQKCENFTNMNEKLKFINENIKKLEIHLQT
ncbi:MAG: hypothetical protein EAZ27_06135 [Cytophagales bacterium]|nr:MAG: hypothetical protein EAZ27_06135 [Cytophagales bacterium]